MNQPTVAKFEAYDSNPTPASIRRYAHAIGALVTHVVETDSEQREDRDHHNGSHGLAREASR